MTDVEAIYEVIKNLTLPAALLYLAKNEIKDLSKKGLEKIKQIIRDKQNEGKFAFAPNKTEADELKNLSKNPDYTSVSLLIPNYKYLDIIRTGLLIRNYHENDTAENRKRVLEIKQSIVRRPNGNYFIKLVKLPTTPHFSQIIQYLYILKKDGYTNEQLKEKFHELVEKWRNSSKFITSYGKIQSKIQDIEDFCKGQINAGHEEFFILGMRLAADKVGKAINKLDKKGFFSENGYEFHLVKSTTGNQPRVEVTVIRKNE